MAGAGFKTFTTGEVLLSGDVNQYLMQQSVMVFDDATARSTALGANVAEGMLSYLEDTDAVEKYDGSSWVAVGGAGLTSPLTTKGDIWGYSTTDARIPVGANGTVLTADSAETTGLKWAAPASNSLTTGYAETVASQSTTSTSFTDLATVTSVTVTTGTKALVIFGSGIAPGNAGYISPDISGASTVAASNDNSCVFEGTEAYQTRAIVFSGLTAGSNTFTIKFRANTGTCTWYRRGITVIDLGS